MSKTIKSKFYNLLRWSQKYTQTDMIYLARDGSWLTLEQVVSSVIAFLSSVAFANLLPKETYGTYGFILSVVAILSIPTLSSMGTAITQAVARNYDGSLIPALRTKIKWGILGGIASLFVSGYYYINNNTSLTIVFIIVAFFIPITNSLNIYRAFLNGRKDFKTLVKYGIINNLISVATLILALFLTKNLYIILLAYFLPINISNYILLKITLHKFNRNNKRDPRTIPYGIYLSLLGIILNVANNIDRILLWHFLGAAQIAVYAFAIAPVNKISGLISSNLSTLAFPKLSEHSEQEIKKTLPKKVLKSFLVIIPIIIIYVIFIPLIFGIIYPKYLDSISYSQIFILSLLFIPTSLFGNTLIAKMKKKEIAIIRFVSPAFRIILLLILTPLYGILGVILAQLIAGVFHVGLASFLFKKMKV